MIQYVIMSRTLQPFDFNNLVLRDIWALEQYLQFNEKFERNGATTPLLGFQKWLFSFPLVKETSVEAGDSQTPDADRVTLVEKLASTSGWSKDVCEQYLGSRYPKSSGVQLVRLFQDAQALREMQTVLDFTKRVALPSLSLQALFIMAQPAWKDLAETDFAQAQTLRLAIQSRRFPSSSGSQTALSQASDSIRSSQQGALLYILLADPYAQKNDLKTPDHLFAHFLIDVQMGPGLQTSRIKQAISSIQLFAQRCALGFEKDVGSDVIDRLDLDFILRYRLWEADRKTYLYPENWADPTLRDNKTEQFISLESKAMESNLDIESIARMIKDYVHEIKAIGNLRVESYVVEHPQADKQRRMYLFACSRSSPPQFYYGSVIIPKIKPIMPLWSSWVPLNMDIPVLDAEGNGSRLGRPGSYIVPASYGGRLFIFLPEILSGQRRNTDNDDQKYTDLINTSIKASTPAQLWEIRMGFSELCNGKWSPKTVCRSVIRVPLPDGDKPAPTVANFNFRVQAREDISRQLTVEVEWIRAGPSGSTSSVHRQHKLGFYQLRDQELVLLRTIGGPPVSEINVPAGEPSELKMTSTEFMRFRSSASSENANFVRQFASQGGPVEESTFLGLPPKEVAPYNCEWLVDYSYPIQNSISAYIFDVTTQDRIEQFIDLAHTDKWRIDYLFNRVVPALAQRAQQENGLEGVYEVLRNVNQGIGTDGSDPHEDAFGRWDEKLGQGLPPVVHYHERSVPYAIYNWELGVHIPMLLVERLMATQQFELALKVIRLVFDPSMDGEGIDRCWIFPPFRQKTVRRPSYTPDEFRAVNEWQLSGGNVHSAARSYPVAYMKRIAGKYIELLLAMGDEHFRRDTVESLPLAAQYYVEALQVFGPEPTVLPQMGKRENYTYNQLKETGLTALSNAIIDLELDFPFYIEPGKREASAQADRERPQSFLKSGYFCIPSNPQILSLGSQVNDRLYKIRNGMDITGKKRTLALLASPIDPGALIASKSSSGGISGFLSSLESPMPRYRFRALISYAFELCNELKSASSQRLAFKEAQDNEALSLLQSRHERAVLALTIRIKEQQMNEITRSIEVLQVTREQQAMNLGYFLALTGDDDSKDIPTPGSEWQDIPQRIETPTKDDFRISPFEHQEMSKADKAGDLRYQISLTHAASKIAFALPQIGLKIQPMGAGTDITIGGEQIGKALQAYAGFAKIVAEKAEMDSAKAGRKATAIKQLQERRLQANVLGRELMRIDKDVAVLEAQIETCNAEIDAERIQIENSQAEEEWLRTKYTGYELYGLLDNSMGTLLHRTYEMTMEFAKVAQRALSFELALRSTGPNVFSGAPSTLEADYWDISRDGYLSGEALWLDLKRMEAVDRDSLRYDYEMNKVVSLRETNPMALLKLLEQGETDFQIPEMLFDMDFPGHFCRRIVSVSVSLVGVTGSPNLACTLTLQQHKYRIANGAEVYDTQPAGNFTTDNIPITSIAVTRSDRDTGDSSRPIDQYAPFEGAGAISSWKISFPSTLRTFNYSTLTDVLIHVRYTSFRSGGALQEAASKAIESWSIDGKVGNGYSGNLPKMLAINLAEDYPTQWLSLSTDKPGQMALPYVNELLPFWAQESAVKSTGASLYVYPKLKKDEYPKLTCGKELAVEGTTAGVVGSYATYDFQKLKYPISSYEIENLLTEDGKPVRRAWLLIPYSVNDPA